MRALEFVRDLVSHGRHHFTTAEAVAAIGGAPVAVRAQLRRLKEKRQIAAPVRGFHVIVPPEYQTLGCPPAVQFVPQLMKLWREPYYFTLLTAAEWHGAAHQKPQVTQVMVRRNRKRIRCGPVGVEFIGRSDLEQMPVREMNTQRAVARVATPEVTALELLGYPGHSGGISNVATVIIELAEELDPVRLVEAARLSPVGWSQRLGYLLELEGRTDLSNALLAHVEREARSYTPLRRSQGVAGAKRSARWKLIINTDVDPDV